MGDCHQGNSCIFGRLVHGALDVQADSAGALVQQSKLRPECGVIVFGAFNLVTFALPVVEEPCHAHALLLTSREHVLPVGIHIPATLTCDDVTQLHNGQNVFEVQVGQSLALHLLDSVRIDDLVAQIAQRHVWPLWDVEH